MKRVFISAVCVSAMLAIATDASASILANAVRDGINTINDTNGDVYTPITPGGNPGGLFMVGDVFDFILVEDNITNSSFLNTVLTTATGGGANYQLAAVGTFTIAAINTPSKVPPGAPFVDLSLTGSIDVYETTSAALAVDFSSPATFAGEKAKVVAGTKLLTLATVAADDFLTQMQSPAGIAGIPSFPGIVGDGGLSVTFAAASLGFNIVTNGVSVAHIDFATGLPVVTTHDLVLREQFFINDTGNNVGEFPFFTDTTIRFQAVVVPEPLSVICWSGLLAASVLISARRRM